MDEIIFGEAENSTRSACAPLLLRFLRPRVSQGHNAVPHLLFRRRTWVEREIAEALKLIAFFRTRICKCGFAFCVRYFERIRIYEQLEIAAGIRLGRSEEPIIQTDFRVNGVRGADPMDLALDLPTKYVLRN